MIITTAPLYFIAKKPSAMKNISLTLLFIALFIMQAFCSQAQNTHILPTPQKVEVHQGHFVWDNSIVLTYDAADAEISEIVAMLRQDLNQISGKQLQFARGTVKGKHFIELIKTDHLGVSENEDQAYKMTIQHNYIRMEATTSAGLFYATQSLKQLYRHAFMSHPGEDIAIPCMTVTDWPNFKIRAWQDDISRGPIVSMDYLKRLIPQMAECKLNAFSLYTEHTFKTNCHPDIAPTDAFTAEEIKELSAYCKPYHIRIIGNQQCFGHFEEILCNPFYSELADTKWNLNPAKEETYRFLEDHLNEMAKVFRSPYFNINCDETESLGQGYAKAYVDSLGASTVYYQHVNRVNRMLRPYRKYVMMWGDIADQHPEILSNLDNDILLIAWNYAGQDSYEDFLKPYVNSGRTFFVAPGVSLSERVWPKHYEFQSNITYLCRDAYRNGAIGVINTCWDDFGESLTNCALYGLVLGGEMSWNPIKSINPKTAIEEKSRRNIEENFCLHFFGCQNTTPLQQLHELSLLTQHDHIGKFSALTEPMTAFYPTLVGDSVKCYNERLLGELAKLAKGLETSKKTVKKNASVLNNALYAVHRMMWCARRNIARCQLYATLNDPTESNIAESKAQTCRLVDDLHELKKEYIIIWNQESRPYWLEVNMKKYDDVAHELLTMEYQPFIESVTDTASHASVALHTLYADQPIHYTLDGKDVTPSDPVYVSPIPLSHSTLVKAACFNAVGDAVCSERYLLSHKAMGCLKQLNSPAGNYSPEYSGGGDGALVDGILGSEDYKDGHWQGFYGIDADIEIDLGKWSKISSIDIGFLVNAHDWILRPDKVEIYGSYNGRDYTLRGTFPITTEVTREGNYVFREKFEIPLSTRLLRIVVKNPGTLPQGHPSAGYDSWIFMDEIVVE